MTPQEQHAKYQRQINTIEYYTLYSFLAFMASIMAYLALMGEVYAAFVCLLFCMMCSCIGNIERRIVVPNSPEGLK